VRRAVASSCAAGLWLALGAAAAVCAAEPEADAAAPAQGASAAEPEPASASGLRLESTSIRGNQELPKVLYIVPWKDPELAEVSGRPVNSLIDEVLAPVDREVFLRQVRYFDQLYGAAGAAD